MLLGQIVAMSFAQNLFYATVLVSQRSSTRAKDEDKDDDGFDTTWSPPIYLEVLPTVISLVGTVMVPTVAHTKYFMPILLVPHLLLFVPAILRPSRNAIYSACTQGGEKEKLRRYIACFQSLPQYALSSRLIQRTWRWKVWAPVLMATLPSLCSAPFTNIQL